MRLTINALTINALAEPARAGAVTPVDPDLISTPEALPASDEVVAVARPAGGDEAGIDPEAVGRPSMWRRCGWYLVAGLVLRLLLAPWTSTPHDVVVWYHEAARSMVNVPLYVRSNFTYPPLWAYPLRAIGVAARWIGLQPHDLGSYQHGFNALTAQLHSSSAPYITTPGFNLAFKLVLFAFDFGTAWLLWRLTLRLTKNPVTARRALVLWWLSPIVIFESAVHGSFDTMVGFFVLATVVALLEGRYVVCGVAVALGVLTKVSPIFLLPLVVAVALWPRGDPSLRPAATWARNLGGLVVGGVAATVVVLAPVAAQGHLRDMFTQVNTHTAGGGVGGVGLLGLTTSSAFASWRSWLVTHSTGLNQVIAALDVGFGILAAVVWPWCRRRFGPGALVLLAAVVIAVTVVTQERAQAQYLLWFLPLLCILAASWRWPRLGIWGVGVGATVFELGVLGPLGFLAPLAVSTNLLSVHTIVHEVQSLVSTPGVIGNDRGLDIEYAGWIILTASMLWVWLSFGLILKRRAAVSADGLVPEAGRGEEPDNPAAGVAVPSRGARRASQWMSRPAGAVAVATASCGLGLAVLLTALSPIAGGTELTVSQVASTGGVPQVTVTTPHAAGPLRVIAFGVAGVATLPEVFVYQDNQYPSLGSTPIETTALERDLRSQLKSLGTNVVSVNANSLVPVLQDLGAAPHRAVVLTAGTLPNTVYSATTDLLAPWIRAGGTVIWSGATPGTFSVGPAPSLIKTPAVVVANRGHPLAPTTYFGCGPPPPNDTGRVIKPAVYYSDVKPLSAEDSAALLGIPFALPPAIPGGSGGCVGRRPSPLASALEIRYAVVNGGPTLKQLSSIGGLALGYTAENHTSVSWLPSGNAGGGTILFAGELQSATMSSDITQILGTGILHTVTAGSWVTLERGQGVRIPVRTAGSSATTVAVAGFDVTLNESYFERTFRALHPSVKAPGHPG